MSENIDKNVLLDEFLLSLRNNEWSDTNYIEVIVKSNLTEAVWSSNFPLGLKDLTIFFIKRAVENIELPIRDKFILLKTHERLELVLMSFLNQFKDDKPIIHKLVTYLKKPESIFTSPESVYFISDKFWNLIEDTSIDFNYYTKRFILMSVIIPTTLFWLSDESKDSLETNEYMKKCFKRSMKIGTFKNNIKKIFLKFS